MGLFSRVSYNKIGLKQRCHLMATKRTIYFGIDVDDKAYHGAGLYPDTGEFLQFKCKPDFNALINKLKKLCPNDEIRLCYEACHIGYPLYHSLTKVGIHCDIIAPSLIPSLPSDRIKTDKIDALNLARYYATGMLTTIYIPNEKDEEIRDLLRSRTFLVKQRKMLKTHILSVCKRYNIYYQKETEHKSNWTVTHVSWLKKRIKELQREVCRIDIEMLLSQYHSLSENIEKIRSCCVPSFKL